MTPNKLTMNKKLLLTAALMLIGGVVMAFAGVEASATALHYIQRFTTAYKINKAQASSINAITAAFAQYGDGDRRKLAYILALAYHESRLKPIKEIINVDAGFCSLFPAKTFPVSGIKLNKNKVIRALHQASVMSTSFMRYCGIKTSKILPPIAATVTQRF